MDTSCAMAEMAFASSVNEASAREVAGLVVRSRNLSPHFARAAHTYAARGLYLQTRLASTRRSSTEASLGLCQVQCCKPFELAMQRGPADYRAKPASLQRYQLAMRSFSRVR